MSKFQKNLETLREEPWKMAAELLRRWLTAGERVDALMAAIPASMGSVERSSCQHLVYGAIRHFGRIQEALAPMLNKKPRPLVQAIMLLAGFELIESGDDGQTARVVHYAVEQSKHLVSLRESGLINAVLRKLKKRLDMMKQPEFGASAEKLSVYYSHPLWLVKRWLKEFKEDAVHDLLKWNQSVPPVYARWRGENAPDKASLEVLEASAWDGFYKVRTGNWGSIKEMLKSGKIFLQDPATRLAVRLLRLQKGMSVLDACAAPGGKSMMIADVLAKAGGGCLVSLDLPGSRAEQLRENLSRVKPGVDVALLEGMLGDGAELFRKQGLKTVFDAILLDVPCSNTGVMRHRVDVKWRLREGDFAKHAEQQAVLLEDADRLLVPGGALVYSTCSIDPEENERVVSNFLKRKAGEYSLDDQVQAYPWESGHDGASVFLLRKRS